MRRTAAITALSVMFILGGGVATAAPVGPTKVEQPPVTLHPKPPIDDLDSPTEVTPTDNPKPTDEPTPSDEPKPTDEPETKKPESTEENEAADSDSETTSPPPTRTAKTSTPNVQRAGVIADDAQTAQLVLVGSAIVLLGSCAAGTWLIATRRQR